MPKKKYPALKAFIGCGDLAEIRTENGIRVARIENSSAIDLQSTARAFESSFELLSMCKVALQREEDAGESAGRREFIEQLREVISKAERKR